MLIKSSWSKKISAHCSGHKLICFNTAFVYCVYLELLRSIKRKRNASGKYYITSKGTNLSTFYMYVYPTLIQSNSLLCGKAVHLDSDKPARMQGIEYCRRVSASFNYCLYWCFTDLPRIFQ